MRKRYYRARVWLDEKEHAQFIRNVDKSGLSRETYLRKLITGYTPKEAPPIEYYEMIRQLTLIGRNLNQIAAKLNSLNTIDADLIIKCLSQILQLETNLQNSIERQV